jgi:hypothetical protein
VDDISDGKLLESYMGGLKQDIKHDIFLRHPTHIMEAMQYAHHIQAKIRLHTCIKLDHTQQEYIFFGVIRQVYLNQKGSHLNKWMK